MSIIAILKNYSNILGILYKNLKNHFTLNNDEIISKKFIFFFINLFSKPTSCLITIALTSNVHFLCL